jgi:hypothetical protein
MLDWNIPRTGVTLLIFVYLYLPQNLTWRRATYREGKGQPEAWVYDSLKCYMKCIIT